MSRTDLIHSFDRLPSVVRKALAASDYILDAPPAWGLLNKGCSPEDVAGLIGKLRSKELVEKWNNGDFERSDL